MSRRSSPTIFGTVLETSQILLAITGCVGASQALSGEYCPFDNRPSSAQSCKLHGDSFSRSAP